MSKSKLILTLTLVVAIVVLSTPNAQADTEVGGPITSDTTWTAANSPYVVTESVEIVEGVTLTVEPGVTVKFESGRGLQVDGDLVAQGVEGSLVTFTSNQTDPAPGDWGSITFTRTATTTMDAKGNYISGSVLQYCVVEYAGLDSHSAIDAYHLLIDHCTVRDNDARGIRTDANTYWNPGRVTNNTIVNNTTIHSNAPCGNYGGGIRAAHSIIADNIIEDNYAVKDGGGILTVWASTIHDNIITGNHAQEDGGGIALEAYYFSGSATVTDNTISGNSAGHFGGGIYAKGGGGGCGSTIVNNTISTNTASGGGAGVYAAGTVDVLRNTIVGNSGPSESTVGGLETWHHISDMRPCPASQMHYNHICDNEPYDAAISQPTRYPPSIDVNGMYNHWGTNSGVAIAERIYDSHDDSNLSEFRYIPYLLNPVGSNHWIYLPIQRANSQ
jgi:predicted outer membrane repeat protein